MIENNLHGCDDAAAADDEEEEEESVDEILRRHNISPQDFTDFIKSKSKVLQR